MDHHRDRDRDRGGHRDSNFHRARNNFEGPRKRKSYPEERGRDDRDYRDDRGDRRRSRSPPRWERGKKQKQKTQTDVPPERELFVGNIPSNVDEKYLLTFLNGAMRHANLCPRHENPCLSCQVNTGNFAFVELLNADYANKCLNLNGILFMNARIKVGRPKKYAGAFVVTKTWQEMMGESVTIDAVLDSEQEKVNRELFVGNTTPEMTDQMISDFLGSAMEQVGLCIMEGNPINTCELFGKYAFIELRTPREASNALNLNNIPFMGSNLQITRPSKWQGTFEQHSNWEHILARFDMKPEEFQLGKILNPSVVAATPTAEPMDGENISVIKAELSQVRRALEITRRQLDEANKKSEARKEQLVSLNRKWGEGKTELNERKQQLSKVKSELGSNKKSVFMDVDQRAEAEQLRRKHEETQGMLRGVTESLVKATEKLQTERKTRKNLEMQLSRGSGMGLSLEPDEEALALEGSMSSKNPLAIDFASLRAEMSLNTEMEDADGEQAAASLQTPMANGNAGIDDEMEDEPKLDSLKEFLSKTPETTINWAANAPHSAEAPRSRDRSGVRLCRLLMHCPDMSVKDGSDVQGMAGKYNLGGYIKVGKPGFIVVEGLEFNCDIFMDNMESQKKKYTNAGKVSERSGRAFPMELTQLEGGSAKSDFAKACESVGLKDKLDAATSK
jgi:RNA recognition motif-containing protein